MENAATIAPQSSRKRSHRSSVHSGRRLFDPDPGKLDLRTRPALQYADIYDQVRADLGSDLSEAQTQLATRFACLSMRCLAMEKEAVSGGEFDDNLFAVLVNCSTRVASRLDLKRIPKLNNGDTVLSDYFAHAVSAAEPDDLDEDDAA